MKQQQSAILHQRESPLHQHNHSWPSSDVINSSSSLLRCCPLHTHCLLFAYHWQPHKLQPFQTLGLLHLSSFLFRPKGNSLTKVAIFQLKMEFPALHFLLSSIWFFLEAQASLEFGSSTLTRQSADWRQLFAHRSKSNRHHSKFLTITMDRLFWTECNDAEQCVTNMLWETQATVGRDHRNCHFDIGTSASKWLPFTLSQQEEGGLGILTGLQGISTGNDGSNWTKEFPEGTKLLLTPFASNKPGFLEADTQLIEEIGHVLGATNSTVWTRPECNKGWHEQVENASTELAIQLADDIKVELNAQDLVYQQNDLNGRCLLAIRDFKNADNEERGHSLILPHFPHQCLLLNLRDSTFALMPRKLAGRRRNEQTRLPANNEIEVGAAGTQQNRREVSEWFSFVFSLI